MSQPVKSEPVFDCLVCFNPSNPPKPIIDFGKTGSYPISVCGECLRKGDKNMVISAAVRTLISFIPPKVIAEKMEEVVAEYREPQQGS